MKKRIKHLNLFLLFTIFILSSVPSLGHGMGANYDEALWLIILYFLYLYGLPILLIFVVIPAIIYYVISTWKKKTIRYINIIVIPLLVLYSLNTKEKTQDKVEEEKTQYSYAYFLKKTIKKYDLKFLNNNNNSTKMLSLLKSFNDELLNYGVISCTDELCETIELDSTSSHTYRDYVSEKILYLKIFLNTNLQKQKYVKLSANIYRDFYYHYKIYFTKEYFIHFLQGYYDNNINIPEYDLNVYLEYMCKQNYINAFLLHIAHEKSISKRTIDIALKFNENDNNNSTKLRIQKALKSKKSEEKQ